MKRREMLGMLLGLPVAGAGAVAASALDGKQLVIHASSRLNVRDLYDDVLGRLTQQVADGTFWTPVQTITFRES